jgi:hypothetical protein
LMPGERCLAISRPRDRWQLVYDTNFSIAAAADLLSRELPSSTIAQFNLQEQVDLTIRVLKNGSALFEYSNEPGFFNWGRCVGKSEMPLLSRPDASALVLALGISDPSLSLAPHMETIRQKTRGEPTGRMGTFRGGVQDAVQSIAAIAGMPRLYRFFEGWMKSDLDWEEDGVLEVRAYRQE